MQAGATDYWHLETHQLKAGDTYQIRVDDQWELTDPAALQFSDAGKARAFDSQAFYWEDNAWVNPSVDTYVCYEIGTDILTSAGAVTPWLSKLPALKAQGVTAIRLQLDGRSKTANCWDRLFGYGRAASFGGPKGLQRLVNACHFNGIAVVLAVDYRTLNPLTNPLEPWYRYLEQLCHNPVVYQHYLIENMLMWLRDFHVDALHIRAPHTPALSTQIRAYADALTRQTGRQYYLLLEKQPEWPASLSKVLGQPARPTGQSTYQRDCVYAADFAVAVQELLGKGHLQQLDRPLRIVEKPLYATHHKVA